MVEYVQVKMDGAEAAAATVAEGAGNAIAESEPVEAEQADQ